MRGCASAPCRRAATSASSLRIDPALRRRRGASLRAARGSVRPRRSRRHARSRAVYAAGDCVRYAARGLDAMTGAGGGAQGQARRGEHCTRSTAAARRSPMSSRSSATS
jgi:hypothetical protein